MLVKDEVVGEWNRQSGSFEVDVKTIDKMKLGFSGESIRQAWTVEMNQ